MIFSDASADMKLILQAAALMAAATMAGPAYPAPAFTSPCIQHLTFRWTSGAPIRIDTAHPVAASLENPPFLRDPGIISVASSRDRSGGTITLTFSLAAAGVLAAESSTHLGKQMLIMSGDIVIIAAMVREPLDSIVVAHVELNDDSRKNLVNLLRKNVSSRGPISYCD